MTVVLVPFVAAVVRVPAVAEVGLAVWVSVVE